MSRIDRLISRFTSTRTLGVSDGASTISVGEATRLVKVIERASDGERARAAARMLASPGMFANTRAEATIRRALKLTSTPQIEPLPATQPAANGITAVRVESARVLATVNGKESVVGESIAMNPVLTIFGNGRYLAYSDTGRMGGYEMEGQAIQVYDSVTGKTTKVLDEYYMIFGIDAVTGKDGRSYLTVEMAGGGRGEGHVAIVDPLRGELYEAGLAGLVGFDGNTFTIEHYNDDDYDQAMEEDRKPKVDSVEKITLADLAKTEVIENVPDEFGEEYTSEIPDDATFALLDGDNMSSRLKVKTADGENDLASDVTGVWPSADGKFLAYARAGHADEGWAEEKQSLWLYSFDREKSSLLFDPRMQITETLLARSASGRLVVLATALEENWDLPVVTAIDARDGDKQEFRGATVKVKNGVATIKQYSEEQWEAADMDPAKVAKKTPIKTTSLDLEAFVNR